MNFVYWFEISNIIRKYKQTVYFIPSGKRYCFRVRNWERSAEVSFRILGSSEFPACAWKFFRILTEFLLVWIQLYTGKYIGITRCHSELIPILFVHYDFKNFVVLLLENYVYLRGLYLHIEEDVCVVCSSSVKLSKLSEIHIPLNPNCACSIVI